MGNGAAAKKIAITALERIERLEQGMQQLFSAIGQTFTTVENRFRGIEELVGGTIRVLGADKVQEAITSARREAEEAQMAQAKANLAAALEKGDVVKAEVIGATSIVVGTETTVEGKPIGYSEGRVQLFIDRIIPAVKEQLLGKAVGTEIETPEKGKFVVTEVYDIVEKPEDAALDTIPDEVEAAVEADLAATDETPAAQ